MATTTAPMESFGNTWLVVTGASRGLGASVCEGLAREIGVCSVVVAFARSEAGLKETQRKVETLNPSVKFFGIVEDLGKSTSEGLRCTLNMSLQGFEDKLTRAILVNNAGSLGPLGFMREMDDIEVVKEYFTFNICSPIILTKVFLELARTKLKNPDLNVINISSLMALQPLKSWGLYCGGKAARDSLFKVLAEEEGNSVDVLNYAPGPLDNDMMVIAQTETKDPEAKNMFQSLGKEKKLVKMQDSVSKLISILKGGKYKSGDHIDYFD